MAPSASRAVAQAIGSTPSSAAPPAASARSLGPPPPHALRCAWERRFARPRYSAAQPRAARRTRVRLRVEAPVRRIAILRHARAAHREPRHGGALAIVGRALDDGEARTAARAVEEGITVAAVGRIEQLAQTIVAGG